MEEDEVRVLCAAACLASYDDKSGRLVEGYLARGGWTIDRYAEVKNSVSADFLVAEKTIGGTIHFLLAVTGTEDIRDLRLDLKMSQVAYGGKTLDEFKRVAAEPLAKDDPTQPRIHKGFNKFVNELLTVRVKAGDDYRPLIDVLRSDRHATVYLTGHSLGGAAVTILGARLVDLGISPEQFAIITFGAPAVGNKAFAEMQAGLPLTRVTMHGDPITQAIQSVRGGYAEFGTEVKLDERIRTLGIAMDNHAIAEYFDAILKDYYDSLPQDRVKVRAGQPSVYVAPLTSRLGDRHANELGYMQIAAEEVAPMFLGGYVLGTDTDWRTAAKASGCKYAVVGIVEDQPSRQRAETGYFIYTQALYNIETGSIVSLVSQSTGDRGMTPLESFLAGLFRVYEEQSGYVK